MTLDPNPKPSKARSRYPRWTMRDGTRVRIEDMSSKHLANTVKLLERKARERWPDFVVECYDAIGMSNEEAGFNVDSATEALEDPSGWEQCLHPMHEHLVAEAKRRGLTIEREGEP